MKPLFTLVTLLTNICLMLVAPLAMAENSIPQRPEQLNFQPYQPRIPDRDEYRHQLIDGNIAYIVEDNAFPIVEIVILSTVGDYFLNGIHPGLSALTGTMLRDGGTESLTPEDLDEKLDFLATRISSSIGETRSSISINTLAENLDDSLALAFDMILKPRFDNDRLELNKTKLIEQIKKRNDDTRSIEPRVWDELIYGRDFFLNKLATQGSINAVSKEMMRTYTNSIFAKGQLVIAVSGAVNSDKIKQQLNSYLEKLAQPRPIPRIPNNPKADPPGLYVVNKEDVNQSRVSIGHPGVLRTHPDVFTIQIMNQILGGGGFTSRITQRVRSDEGLAYSAGSAYRSGRHYPGEFIAYFQSKNESVPLAIKIILEEIKRIQTTDVTEQELAIAKQGSVSFLNDLFSSASRIAGRFAIDEINQEDKNFWKDYRAKIESVTISDVKTAANKHLKPEQLRILVVGDIDQVKPGDGTNGTLEAITQRSVSEIPLRDPLTLQVLVKPK